MGADNGLGRLTTHVLDTASGLPAAGLEIELYLISQDSRELIKAVRTNSDGRCDDPLLEGSAFGTGIYELVFKSGAYHKSAGLAGFYPDIPVRFEVVSDQEHFHVPLLLSPYGYSTYRGS